MFESNSERIKRITKVFLLSLLLTAEIVLASCGGSMSDSRPETPTARPEPTHRTALYQYFCGLYLNRIHTTTGTGTAPEFYTLFYNTGDNPLEQFVNNGGSIKTPECGPITFTGPSYYVENGNRQPGGAGFLLPEIPSN